MKSRLLYLNDIHSKCNYLGIIIQDIIQATTEHHLNLKQEYNSHTIVIYGHYKQFTELNGAKNNSRNKGSNVYERNIIQEQMIDRENSPKQVKT